MVDERGFPDPGPSNDMQGLWGDSAPRLDSCGYRRYCLQKFAWILKAPPGVFLKERRK
jgi:hypothetical protein